MQLHELGYGEYEDVLKRIPLNHNIIILDENLASVGATSCWFSTSGNLETVRAEYEYEYGEADIWEV